MWENRNYYLFTSKMCEVFFSLWLRKKIHVLKCRYEFEKRKKKTETIFIVNIQFVMG